MQPSPILYVFQCLAQLVGAAGGATVAADMLQSADDLFDGHPFHQSADALQVAVAAAVEDHIVQRAVVAHVELNSLATCALCEILVVLHLCIKLGNRVSKSTNLFLLTGDVVLPTAKNEKKFVLLYQVKKLCREKAQQKNNSITIIACTK